MVNLIYVSNSKSEEQGEEILSADEAMALTLNDAIKAGLVESIRNQTANTTSSLLQTSIKRTEVVWYINNLYSPLQIKQVDKKKVIELTFSKLLEPRQINLTKIGRYLISGEAIKDSKEEIIGVTLTARHEHTRTPK